MDNVREMLIVLFGQAAAERLFKELGERSNLDEVFLELHSQVLDVLGLRLDDPERIRARLAWRSVLAERLSALAAEKRRAAGEAR